MFLLSVEVLTAHTLQRLLQVQAVSSLCAFLKFSDLLLTASFAAAWMPSESLLKSAAHGAWQLRWLCGKGGAVVGARVKFDRGSESQRG